MPKNFRVLMENHKKPYKAFTAKFKNFFIKGATKGNLLKKPSLKGG